MARKRYKKKRADYRKGGRVRFDAGGRGDDWRSSGALSRAGSGRYYATGQNPRAAVSPDSNIGPGSVNRTADEIAQNLGAVTNQSRAGIAAGANFGSQTIGAMGSYMGGSAETSPMLAQGNPVANTAGYTGGAKTGGGTGVVKSQKGKGRGKGGKGQGTDSGDDKDKKVNKKDPMQEKFEADRAKRVIRTGDEAQDIASGLITPMMNPRADVRSIPTTADTKVDTVQMEAVSPITAETVPTAAQEATAQVTDVAQAEAPQPITAAQMQPVQITEAVDVTGVTGTVSDDAIAQAAEVEDTPLIQGADVTIQEGALADRVVGTLSPEAMATAAQAAGTTLSRVTRAKRQLRNAGISEDSITALGNDPEALEARLMDLTQEERGVIGDLPEEALVSNQLDSLLKGLESGEIPAWASPAVSAVEQMLARRGLEASTVGQENLFNAIIQSAVPIAQSNAQAIQQSVAQTRDLESKEELANVQMRQQTALQNAGNVFQMDMAQFSADQQTALSNSKFLQTVSLTEANNDQQAAIQNALILSQSNLAEANMRQQMAIQNAKTFLTMDMANLNNQQQANLVTAQYQQQTLLSNQAAENAAKQTNAASENQTNQFVASLNNQINQYNATAMNQAKTINAQMQNAANARNADRINDVNKANAAMLNQTAQFNSQMDFNRNQWNAANKQAVLNSNVNWMRQVNTANTAAQNAVNQQNAQNAFTLTREARAFLMQELRDQADYDFKWANNEADRKVNAMIAAASAEGDAAKYWSENYENAAGVIDEIFGG